MRAFNGTFLRIAFFVTTGSLAAPDAFAEVTRIEILTRQPYANGREFEGVGAYQVLRGKVYFEVDPRLPTNQSVVDLELAPRNERGRVEFSADLEILTPVDSTKGNRAILYDVNNRGNKVALGQFNIGADEFLMRKGFTVVWSGWIAETQPGGGRLRLNAPLAMNGGQPITGLVRAEIVVDEPRPKWTLAMWANQGSYEPTERGERDGLLTWRLREKDERVVIPRSQWRLEKSWVEADGERGQLPHIDLVVAGGLQPGWIYELGYEAQGPIVQGLGLAGIRDLVSCLKYDRSDRNPLRPPNGDPAAKYAYGFGVSQSGRCLRMFLNDGFNADEHGRQVFDGVIPHVAGAGLGFFNHRFASPTRHNGQHDNHLFPADMFPFTYGDERDPFSRRIDGILRRARASNTVPKVFHTQSSSEYWHRAGSLVHTDPLGQRDAVIPPEVRIYSFGGTQHGPGSGTIPSLPYQGGDRGGGGLGALLRNPADYRPFNRALLMALDAWVREGKEPPPSVYPRIADGTLLGWRERECGWQALPGVRYPEVIHQPEFLDRGPDFLSLRRIAIEPPVRKGNYVVKTAAYGPDNRERGLLDLPDVAVPVGTYTSWNLRNRTAGAEGELLGLTGGYIPLAKTTGERQASGDPRPALLERYKDFDDYLGQYLTACRRLVEQRYLLEEDLPRLRALAESRRKLFE
jgi:hypothetical protein